MNDTILVCRESFTTDIDGVPTPFTAGVTRVREGHPIIEGREHLFEPVTVHYEIEQTTAAPGEKRARSPKRGSKKQTTAAPGEPESDTPKSTGDADSQE